MALTWVSCSKEGPGSINEIKDHYVVPTDAVEVTLSGAESTWATDRRYFDLSFGSALTTKLVGYDALLAPGQYILGADEIGRAILEETKVNGAAAKEGYITVTKSKGEDVIVAHVDGGVYVWKGSLPFEPDPDPLMLSEVLSTSKNAGLITMNLATEGIHQELDMTTYQTTWVGEGYYLALDLYSEDGYLHDGEYWPSKEGGVVNPGEFGIGWDPGDLYGIGWIFTDWGTCLWKVSGGVATAEKITTGLVTVTSEEVDDVVIWTIYWGVNYPREVLFSGAIPALTKPKPVVKDPDYLYTETLTPGDACDVHAVTITDKDGNELAYLEIQTAPGATDLSGSYVSTSYASEPGQLRNGYNFPDWGVSGGSWYMNGEEKAYIDVGPTVIVTSIGVDAYFFQLDGAFSYDCAGPNYVPAGGGDDDVTGDVVLKITSGLTYTMEDVTASNTAADGSPLSGMTLWRVTISNEEGFVAAFDLGTEAGSEDITGDYTVMSYPDAVGKAGNGWGFLPYMAGGCYFKIGEAYYFIPADAVFTVSANSDGTLKFKFEGPIQKDDYSEGGQGGLLLNNVAKQ